MACVPPTSINRNESEPSSIGTNDDPPPSYEDCLNLSANPVNPNDFSQKY